MQQYWDEDSIYAARQGMRAVYMQQDRGMGTVYMQQDGDEGSIHAARRGMRAVYMQQDACNNNNMRNPSLHHFYYGVTHVIIVACPHPLSCCI